MRVEEKRGEEKRRAIKKRIDETEQNRARQGRTGKRVRRRHTWSGKS
jgi:hypothetical protein